MKSRLFACVIVLLAIQMSAFAAAVRVVPTQQYPTIQSAVTASQDGDMVVVQRISANGGNNYTVPGPNLANPGGGITIPAGVANLTIRSYTPADPCCVADTVIDCGNSGRAFNFVDDQQCQVIIEGFTIINGRAVGPIGIPADTPPLTPAYDPSDPNTWVGQSVVGDGMGGAIYIGSANTPGVSISPVIRNCVFQNCHVYGAVGGGGARGPVITDPNFGEIGDSMPGGRGGDGDGNGLGAAIYCGIASTPTVINCIFSNNFAHGGIGGAGGNSANVAADKYPGRGGNGGNGIGNGQGGAIYADQLSDPNITRCTFTSNTATVGVGGAGGLHGSGKIDDADHPVFDGTNGSALNNGMRNGGAVYYNTQSSNNLNSSTFEHNNADDSGGAIYCASGSILNINAGCVFNHNQALNGSGGALGADALCIFDIHDTKFLSNYAWFDGGAINAGAGCNIYISNSSLNANTAGVDDGVNFTWGDGGAISTTGGSVLEINLCSFGLNKATQYGGAVSAIGDAQRCKAAMYSTSVISNQALLGGGIYFDKFQPIDPSVGNPNPDLLANCTFISNLGEDAGGGMYLVDNSVGFGSRIVDCDITDNSVFGGYASGGGAYLNSVESTFENCRILRNSSSGSGGSIYFIAPYTTEVKNCLFVDNSAVNDGSAISSNFNINYSLVQFTNNTFSKNIITSPVGEGGAVYNNGFCNPVISDCIFYQCNKAAVYESDETSQSLLNNNLFYSNPNGDYRVYTFGGAVVYTGAVAINNLPNANNNIDDDPMFVSGDLGDYYLSQIAAGQFQNSKAVDAGSTSAVLAGLDMYTTRTDSLTNPDEANDVNAVDLGYHYHKTADMTVYHLTIEIVNPYGTVTTIPAMENNDFYSGTVVTLVAKPNFSYRVAYWQGTESDSSTALTNTVIMNSDKTVRIEFETPKVLKVKSDGGIDYYSDIRDALFDAQDGDVIEIYKGVYRGPVIELYKNVHIRSRNPNDPLYVADTIIDRGGYRERAFLISSVINSSTVIDGLTMINAGWTWSNGADGFRDPYFAPNGGDGSPFHGGCIYISAGASPVIKNCIIRDNYGQAGGGGNGVGAQEDPPLNAGRGGWGGWSRGGAVYCGTGSAPQFINCKFENNRAIGGSGGNGGNAARGVAGNYGGNWSTFRSPEFPNIDPRIGGIRVIDTVPDIELWDLWSQMANSNTDPYGLAGTLHNRSDGYYGDYKWYGGYGGAVYCGLNSNVTFIGCDIVGNEVLSGMSGLGGMDGGKLREPQISYELPSFGAGVYCDANSNTLFEGCTISNNIASEMQGRYRLSPIVSHGGGVCSEDTASVIFRNCHINENQADVGGGIHFSDSNPVIEDSNIVENIAMQGGGIYGDHGVADIIGCNIIGNQARSLTDPNVTYITDGAGGGIHISSLDVNIVDCLISENLAEYSGGGLFFDGGEYQSVINCLITDNLAGHDGGGIAVTTWSEPTISNCTIVGNRIVSVIGGLASSAAVAGLTTYGDNFTQNELDSLIVLLQDSPPPSPEQIAMRLQAQPVSAPGDVVIGDVPTSTWTYGCSATAAGMIFGYYDRNGYPNMYTGPTNGGIVPLINVGQGDDPNNPIAGACSIIATQNGFDGRTTNGHVDDYWIAEGAAGPDPWEATGVEHKWGSCTADFMGTNQWKWDWRGDDNGIKDSLHDSGTWFWFEPYGEKIYNFVPPSSWGLPATEGCHGMRLFAESRGYIVTENYSQLVDTYAAGGFSFADYQAEIDAGNPVLIQVTGHTMTGVGYNAQTQEIILHNTWYNQQDRMPWGGYYEDMQHLGVTVIHLESDPSVFGAGVDISNGGSAIIVNSIIWGNNGVQISLGVEEEPSSAYVTYSNIGPGEVPVYVETNSFIQGWDPNLYPDSNGWAPDNHNINQDPLFLSDYLLSQISAGQLVDSPAVDAGSDLASVLGFEGYTTRTDSGPDEGIVDMGYHHPMFDTQLMELNFRAVVNPDLGVMPVIDPCGITYYTQYTTVTLTVSDPPANYQVEWSGSDNDNLLTTTNTIHMDTNKNVVVGFVKNYCILNVNVVAHGGFEVSPEPDANGVYPRDTVVTITAVPDAGYRVKKWTGTADDTSLALKNTVVMDGDKTVTIEFEKPSVISVPGGDVGSLQAAIDNAKELDTIILLGGTYRVQRGFDIIGKNIIIQSSNPDDPNIVAGTIIEQLLVPGGGHSGAFTFQDVGPQTVLNGITIRNFTINVVKTLDADDDPNDFASRSGFNGGTLAGVAIYCSNASLTVKNCRFVNCGGKGGDAANGANGVEASPNGGMGGWPGGGHGGAVAMYVGWDANYEELHPSNPTFINCDFINNYVRGGNGGNGGDGFEDEDKGIYGVPGLGGGWYYGEPYSFYYDSIRVYWPWGYHFDERGYSGDGQYDEYTRYSGLGGAVFVGPNCNPVFKGCNFEGNRSYGGFCGIPGMFPDADLRIAPAAPLKIDSLGGAVYCDTNSAPYFYDCNFVDNEADANIPADNDKPFISFGGGVAARDDAKPVFEKCSFSNNFATIGGGLYCGNIDAKIIDCNFVGNSAFHGAGLYYADGDGLVDNTTIISNVTVQPRDPNIFSDEIFGLGGGMYITTSSAMIVDCNISMNYTGASGGGVYFSDADSILKNCLITSNIAGRDGGGVSLNWSSLLNVSNCTVADNIINGINFPSPYNYGGGLYCGYGSDANIIDSIFWGNTAGSGHQLAVSAEHVEDANTVGSTLGVSYSIVLGGKAAVFIGNECDLIWGAGNLNVNPLFVSGFRGDYFLSHTGTSDSNQVEDSPAINAGSGNAADFGLSVYTTRTDGRYDQGVVDMGYHYPVGGDCQICDLDNSGKVEFGDLAILAQYWLYSDTECTVGNNWCQGANLVIDDQVDFKDYSRIVQCWMATTTDMKAQWLRDPYAKLPKFSIGMSARPVVNSWGWDVEYYFQCLEDAGADSGWQEESEYTATNLLSDTIYSFRFKVRDISPNHTESEWSEVEFVFSGSPDSDLTAPTPNRMTWEIEPAAAGPNSVTMRASLAQDDVIGNGVQYNFIRLAPYEAESGWQDGQDYVDNTVEPNTVYTYQVIARDVPAHNETEPSAAKSATTGVEDKEAPNPNPSVWATWPYPSGGYHHMVAVQANDDLTGGNNPVWYYFESPSGGGGGVDSGWRRGDLEYLIPGTTVMAKAWEYSYLKTGNCVYQVKTCDSIPGSNPPQPNCNRTVNGVYIKGNETTPSPLGATY